MGGKKIEDLKMRLELLGEKVWDNEEKVKRCMECNFRKETELRKIKAKMKALQDKVIELGRDLAQLLLKGGAK